MLKPENTMNENINFEKSNCCTLPSFQLSDILKALGAENFFPHKLTAKDLLKPKFSLTRHLTELDPPIIQLAKGLLHFDFSVICGKKTLLEKDSMKKSGTVENVEDLFGTSADIHPTEKIHPIDCLIILLECCDDLLKQDIITKLAKCQIAIPLIVPNLQTFLSDFLHYEWSLRQIGIVWKMETGVCKETDLANLPSTFVSFLRISNSNLSKSRLASRVIKNGVDDKHCYFIDREESKCLSDKLVSAGLVDIFWNVPRGDPNDSFKSPVIAFNLHGCCSAFPQQFEFLCAVSHLLFIIIDDDFDKNHLNIFEVLDKSTANICFLHSFTLPNVKKRFKEALNKTNLITEKKVLTPIDIRTNSNVEIIADEVRNQIESIHCLNSITERKVLQTIDIRTNSNVETIADEVRNKIESGYGAKTLADTFKQFSLFKITSENTSSLLQEIQNRSSSLAQLEKCSKNEIFHLQQFLNTIVPMIKEKKRLKDKGVTPLEDYTYKIQTDLVHFEKLQRRILIENLSVQGGFLSNLLWSFNWASKNPKKMLFFLRWIGITLDTQARYILQKLHSKHNKLREASLNVQEKDKIKIEQDIENTAKDIKNASFGVEHLFREISSSFYLFQSEEVKQSLDQFTSIMQALPRNNAQILLDGFPLEIMNGDSGFVDVLWLQKLFQELCSILGSDERVCVVSVLGIQSSGKSTLLNTMFGINFTVRSGRCTKGIYAQLIELDMTYIQRLGCKYILILDTEGLRAPELKTVKGLSASDTEKDNELATFIVGLADLTIINVMGEADADIHETLQITVHAMLRMKIAKLNPKCLMIHQHVTDTMITENSINARENIQKFLDQTTVDAAAEEGKQQMFQCFADVIDFNCADSKQICYLPSFFSGSHVNPKYVSKVREFRDTLFHHLENKSLHQQFISFPELSDRIKHLWNAILEEDFVFSFKNAIAIKASQLLDSVIVQWYCSLTKSCETKISEVRNKIKLLKEIPDAEKEMFANEFTQCMENHLQKILADELEKFFQESQFKEIIIQWKENTILKLQGHCDELIIKNWSECSMCIQNKQMDAALMGNFKHHEQKLKEITKKQLSTLDFESNKNISEHELKEKFEIFWNNLIGEVKRDLGINAIKLTNVEAVVWNAIECCGFMSKRTKMFFLNLCNKKSLLDAADITAKEWDKYVTFEKNAVFVNKDTFIAHIAPMNAKWVDDMQKLLDRSSKEASAVVQQPHRILFEIDEQVKEFMKSKGITFSEEYRTLLGYTFYKKAIPSFNKQQQIYVINNDPSLRLENEYKGLYWNMFAAMSKNLQGGQYIAETMSRHLAAAVTQNIQDTLPTTIQDFILTSDIHFISNKHTLLAYMLCDLGETLNNNSLDDALGAKAFSDFCSMFKAPFKFIEHYVKEKMKNEHSSSHESIEQIALERLKDCHKALENIFTLIKDCNSIKEWIECAQNEINQSSDFTVNFLPLLEINFVNGLEEIVDKKMSPEEIDDFKECMKIAVDKRFKDISICVSKEHYEIAADGIISSRLLIGCKECCPFCGSFCELSVEGHDSDHYSALHCPQALSGSHFIDSKKLTVETCPILVASKMLFCPSATNEQCHPYKDYRQYFPKWDIPPDKSLEGSRFWKWFVAKYGKHLAKHYDLEPPDIPQIWEDINFEQAKKALEEEYNVTIKIPVLLNQLKAHIIGQNNAVKAVVRAIEVKEKGWTPNDPPKPVVLMFLGPSGTGKTETAKRVSEYWNKKTGQKLIRLDMSEFQEEHSVAKIIGSPPGYIGHDAETALLYQLIEHPKAVVLIDEIEKAHPKVFTIFFQMFDEGRLTGAKKNTALFPDAVFILTSNTASDLIYDYIQNERSKGRTEEEIVFTTKFEQEQLRPKLKAALIHDALLGRIDKFVCFKPFSKDNIEKLADVELKACQKKVHYKSKSTLTWDHDVIGLVVSRFIYQEGARSVKKAVEDYIISALYAKDEFFEENSSVHLSVKTNAKTQMSFILVTVT